MLGKHRRERSGVDVAKLEPQLFSPSCRLHTQEGDYASRVQMNLSLRLRQLCWE